MLFIGDDLLGPVDSRLDLRAASAQLWSAVVSRTSTTVVPQAVATAKSLLTRSPCYLFH